MYNALLRPFSVVGPPGVGLFPVVLAGFLDEKQGIFLSVNDGKLNGVEHDDRARQHKPHEVDRAENQLSVRRLRRLARFGSVQCRAYAVSVFFVEVDGSLHCFRENSWKLPSWK